MADAAASDTKSPTGDVNVNDLVPFCGCVCFMTSCYTEWPNCVGCAGNTVCCCINSDFLACKFPTNPEHWWTCQQGSVWMAPVKVCCSQRVQMCCLDGRGSIPPTDEVPCMLTVCFFTLLYKSKSVMKFKNSIADLETAAGSA